MKIKSSIFAAAFALLAFSFAACSGGDSGGDSGGSDPVGISGNGGSNNGGSGTTSTTVAVTGVSITDKSTTTLTVGKTLQLSATVTPSNATNKNIKWSSSKEDSAIVNSSGLVTGLKAADSVVIYAKSAADESISDYLVLKIIEATVKISGSSTISSGGQSTLTALAQGFDFEEITYKWEITSGSEYAELSESSTSTATLTGKNTTEIDAEVVVKVTATCGSGESKTTVEDTFSLTVAGTETTVNDEITAVSVTAEEINSVEPGESVTLTAIPTYTGNPTITFSWEISESADYGELSKSTENSVKFTAKNSDTSSSHVAKVKVTASDGANSVSSEISVTVSALKLSKIEITTNASKTTYKIGEEFDSTGLVVTATYSDGSTKDVASSVKNDFDASSTGTKTVTLSYTEGGVTKTASLEVSVYTNVVDEIKSVSIKEIAAIDPNSTAKLTATPTYTGNPTITYSWKISGGADYGELSESSTSTVKFTAKNSDSSSHVVKVKVTASDGTNSVYDEIEITVNKFELREIKITSAPTKTAYSTGDEIDLSGLVVTASYSDGSTKTLSETDYKTSGFDSDEPGTKTITVSYTDGGVTKTATFDVTFTFNSKTLTKDFSDIFKSISSAKLENEEIATLSTDGLSVSITPKAKGKTTLAVSGTTSDGTLNGYVLVTVAMSGTITLGEFRETSSTTLVTKITISADASSVASGKTLELSATVKPSNATNKALTWSSSNTSVASVDVNGIVTGVSTGSATITATAADGSGVKGEIKINVVDEGKVIGTVY